MHKPPNKRAVRLKLTVLYTVVPILILSVSLFLVFYGVGYRFNPISREVSQGGLLQVESRPSGAEVTVDNKNLSGLTSTRADLDAGLHTVMLMKDGYRPWQKTITIEPGKILWLDYMLLVPTDPAKTSLLSLPLEAKTLASSKGQVFAALSSPGVPEVSLIRPSGDKVVESTLAIPDDILTSSKKQSFELIKWDDSARYLIIKHYLDESSELLLIDTKFIDKSINLTSIADDAIDSVEFRGDSQSKLYALVNHQVREIDIARSTISMPVVADVEDFSVNTKGVIVYVSTNNQQTRSRSVGLYSDKIGRAVELRTYQNTNTRDIPRASFAEYLDKQYLITQYDGLAEINIVPSLQGDNVSLVAASRIAAIATPSAIESLEFSSSGRFAVILHKDGYLTYDLELGSLSNINLRSVEPGVNFGSLNPFYFWSVVDGKLSMMEFDGTNRQDLTTASRGQSVLLSKDYKSIFFFDQIDNSLWLRKVSLVAK